MTVTAFSMSEAILYIYIWQLINYSPLRLQGDTFKPGVDWGFQPLDKVVNIYWPVPEGVSTVMSGKDRDAAELSVSGTIKPRRIRVLVIGASGQGIPQLFN